MPGDAPRRNRVFISYSHADALWLERLRVHFKSLELIYGDLLDTWDDTRIQTGEPWKEQIQQALNSAKIAILLVSADFLASEFINTEELPLLLAAAKNDGLRIIPVILRPCRFGQIASISLF